MQDLFGEVPDIPARGKHYVKAAGYAMPPGTGPAGETCGTCEFHVVKRMAKHYHKCKLAEAKWTGGRKTDILTRSPACAKWQATSL